eukprot:gene22501-29138_t
MYIFLASHFVSSDANLTDKLSQSVSENSIQSGAEQQYQQKPNEPSLEHLDSLDVLDPLILVNGINEMAKHKIVIAGITRNNAPDLAIMIKTIEHIGSFFQDYRVIIFENDSNDGTKAALAKWGLTNTKLKVISEDYHIKKRPSIKFLANARNKYIDALKSDDYIDFDMVMVLDMDFSYGIDIRGIQDSFAKIGRWDGVCSNGIFKQTGEMWDAFAFRNDEFPYNSNVDGYWQTIVHKVQKIYPVGSDLVPVQSCFGGMAIYKKSSITNCKYDSIDEQCEH